MQQPEPVSGNEMCPHLLRVLFDLLVLRVLGDPNLDAPVPPIKELMPGGRVTCRHAVDQVAFFFAHERSLPNSQFWSGGLARTPSLADDPGTVSGAGRELLLQRHRSSLRTGVAVLRQNCCCLIEK